jgi:hypothetical protein
MSTGQPMKDPHENEAPQSRSTGHIDALETLREELARLKAEVEALHNAGAARLPASAAIVAGENLGPEQGFYPVERTEDGVAFCWTGPGQQFSFAVLIDRFNGADLRLEGISFIDFDRQKAVELQADGQPVPITVEKGGIGVVIAGTLPPRTGKDPTALVFTLPDTLLPPSNPDDKRQLGLAFFKLTLTARG